MAGFFRRGMTKEQTKLEKPMLQKERTAANLVGALVEQPSARLLKHIVRCFLRLSDNARAREA